VSMKMSLPVWCLASALVCACHDGMRTRTGLDAGSTGDSSLPGDGLAPAACCRAALRGVFSATGDLTQSRFSHTATLLCDGTVLLAGSALESSADLYDVSTGRFTATGSMSTGRGEHTATLLRDGEVLIAGGTSYSRYELYDPSTGKFRPTGSIVISSDFQRLLLTATLLADGRVLVAGGTDNAVPGHFGGFRDAETYDPETGLFTATSEMLVARSAHTATMLPTGKVLVAGGSSSTVVHASAELYDPSQGVFTATGSMTTARAYHTATLLTDGTVLIIGGRDLAGKSLASAELYDAVSGTFVATGSMNSSLGRWAHTATLLCDGSVLIVGGDDSNVDSTAEVERYLPAERKFVPAGRLTSGAGRVFHTSTLLCDGRVLVAGGAEDVSGDRKPLQTAEIYE
jgi:large repetitive protein